MKFYIEELCGFVCASNCSSTLCCCCIASSPSTWKQKTDSKCAKYKQRRRQQKQLHEEEEEEGKDGVCLQCNNNNKSIRNKERRLHYPTWTGLPTGKINGAWVVVNFHKREWNKLNAHTHTYTHREEASCSVRNCTWNLRQVILKKKRKKKSELCFNFSFVCYALISTHPFRIGKKNHKNVLPATPLPPLLFPREVCN